MRVVAKKFIMPLMGSMLLVAALVCPGYGKLRVSDYYVPPRWAVSPYDELPIKPSVALSSPWAPLYGYRFNPKPRFRRASFIGSSLTFNTLYYQRGNTKKWLVPVTVDASDFLSYRKRKKIHEAFTTLMTKSITNPQKDKRRGGLGIQVGLPKRLNKIFGEGGAGLRVSGFRKIMFSGRSQWNDAAQSELYRQSKFPSLNMEQIYRFDINGSIGSKITVKVSEDSRQDIPLANRLIIRYKGDDDDVLKSIEAGNTTLSLPRTKFVGYSSNIKGLFGLKAEAQVGHLHLVGIASQEQGSSERVAFSPTGEENAQYYRDYDYVQRRVFDLAPDTLFQPGDSVIKLFVYEQVDKQQNPDWLKALMVVDPRHPDAFVNEKLDFVTNSKSGVVQIDQSLYSFYSEPSKNQHYVVFTSSRLRNRALGIYMEIKRGDTVLSIGGDTVLVVDGDSTNVKLLKLLWHSAPTVQFQTWNLMWRNCYAIPTGMTAEDAANIKVFRGSSGNEGSPNSLDYQEDENGNTQSLIEILGLDQYNTYDEKIPDGKFDTRWEIFRKDWGLIIFPHRRPFAGETTFVAADGSVTMDLVPKAPGIYDYESENDKTNASRYYIQFTTQTRNNIISLRKPNIIEGSERITVNGELLKKGVDYNIQYDMGQVTLLSSKALDPNADLDIQFEYAPFFAVQKKTLLGMRAEYTWSKNLGFGATLLYKSDKAQDRKPRIGQETARSFVYAVDGSWRTKVDFLTDFADAIPLIETEAQSTFHIEGELAQSHPNPNVNNLAYLDDFEAAQEHLTLGLQRTIWKKASRPLQADPLATRSKMLWHMLRDPIDVREVWNVDPKQGEGSLRPLRLIFRPNPDSARSWAGIMRGYENRIDANRVQLLELRAKVNPGAKGKMHIDIGTVNDDVNNNGAFDTEDKLNGGNGVVEKEEDVGLDGLADVDEPGYDPDTLPDPNGDNWYFMGDGKCPLPANECNSLDWDNDSIYYEWLNGTEGNRSDPGWLGLPDDEALNRSGGRSINAYFSYVIDFDNLDSFRVENSERNGWWTYRIPIRDSLALDTIISDGETMPSWSTVTHIRIWFESEPYQAENDTIQIADWYFVQSNWQDSVLYGEGSDSSTNFVVASISDEDLTFTPPPGVEPYRDPNYNTTEAQRGLLLKFDHLSPVDTCLAVKSLYSVDKYSGYRRLEMYVYGGITPEQVGKVLFFFRVGKDADNYYEQRVVIDTGWNKHNYINIDFNEATALKDSAMRRLDRSHWNQIDIYSVDSTYHVRGNPNINDIKFYTAGIVNLSDEPLDGEVWLDELRVTDVRNDVGTAARLSFGGSIADLMSYNFSFESRDAYFRELSSATRGGGDNNLGSGKTDKRMSYNASLNLDKFLPRSWGARIPISYSHSKSEQTPLLRTGSDIILPEAIREQEKSVTESNSFNVSESFNRKGRNPLFNLLLNRVTSSFRYGRSTRRSVNNPYNFSENYNISSSLNLGVKKPPTLPIFFWTKPFPLLRKFAGSHLGLFPTTWTMNASYSRSINISDDINFNRRTNLSRGFQGTMDLKYQMFENLSATYRYSTTRDLTDLNLVKLSLKDPRLGLETQFSQTFNVSYKPTLFSFLTHAFSFSSSYRDTYDRSTKTRQSTMSSSWSVNGTFDHMKLFRSGKRGRRAPSRHRGGSAARGQEADTTAQKTSSGKPFYDPPLAVLRFLTGWINPFNLSYKEGFGSNVPGMTERPAPVYRFGLARNAAVPVKSAGRAPSSKEDKSYQVNSGFSLLGGVSVGVKFSRSISQDIVKQGARYKSVSTTWPDLSIRIKRFKRLPLIKGVVNKLIDVFSPKTGYSRQQKESYDIDGGFLKSRSTSVNYNPLLSVNFKVYRSLSLTSSVNMSKNSSEKYNPTTGVFESETRSTRSSLTMSTSYSFSAPSGISIPLFGKIRFRSKMSISLDVKKNFDKSETRRFNEGWVVSSDKSDFSIRMNTSYNFSQQIKGGLLVSWQDSSDNFKNRNNHVRQVEFWVEIRF